MGEAWARDVAEAVAWVLSVTARDLSGGGLHGPPQMANEHTGGKGIQEAERNRLFQTLGPQVRCSRSTTGEGGDAHMFANDCHDRLRFRLDDDDGLLRFVEFEILNASRCQDIEETLQEYMVGRALADVDLDYLRELTCTGNGECMQAVIQEVQKHQRLFVRNHEGQSATC